jgi:polysaccharide export outer membrane protein
MEVTVRGVTDWSKRLCVLVLLAAGPGLLTAQCQDQTKEETPQQTNLKIEQLAALARAVPADVPVGPGDGLHIEVFDVPELTRDLRVTESGEIGIPLLPERVKVAGLTTFQIEQRLAELLSSNGLVVHPEVSVYLREQTSQPISVIGAVGHAMVFQGIRPMTLLEVLAQAGGISDDAGEDVVITRNSIRVPQVKEVSEGTTDSTDATSVTTGPHTITIRLQDLIESGNTDYNIQIIGGDIVNIPRAGIVYILGFGIGQAGGYVMQGHGDKMTTLKAVALAHGLTAFARADDSVILRNNSQTGKRDLIHVPLKKIQAHKADDVELFSNDILYIPDSKAKKALARGTEAVLGLGTQVAIYRVQ